ncbi:MAG: AGE family epimerase/isomerase [Gammaproteobacteria bacterium]|nr:AGE family epimerase/isomerase [Gammaproteobacteria bacterium]
MKRLQLVAKEFERWIRDQALPLWAGAGFNHTSGVSYERLLADGKPDLEVSNRVRVQARQIFVFAFAQYLGWYSDGYSRTEKMLTFVERVARHPTAENGYIHLLDSQFRVIDKKQDLYDHTFHLLANIWCYRAFDLQECLHRAESLIHYLDTKFASRYGGWLEGDYIFPARRQNPHMHMFEVMLAFYDATGDSKWLDRAGEIYHLFVNYFYDGNQEVLFEYFNEDWTLVAGEQGKIVEPGHMLEWVWLLRWYESRTNIDVSKYADAMYRKTLEVGVCPETGLIFDEVLVTGGTIKASKRCWPTIEYIKASIAQARKGNEEAIEHTTRAIEKLMLYYIDPAATAGAYIDQRAADNSILVDHAPASTLYHLIVAAAEVSDFVRRSV